ATAWPRGQAVALFLIEGDEAELEGVPMTPAEETLVGAFLKAHDAWRDASSIEEGLVGLYKFKSNDGWWVNPDECRIIADKIREHAEVIAEDFFTDAGYCADTGRQWLKGWADFNALAAENGGYRVH
ncbi:MAG: hypothetical protein AAFX99_29295, partial [Myxococcota bacterium]